jgi:ABC-type transport system involved in multi-copper enzyme maturation permease subunit
MNGILRDTLAELVDRKILYVFLGVTAIAVIVVAATSSVDLRVQITGPGDFVGDSPTVVAESAVVKLFGGFLSLLIFLAAMASASLVPNMLERGLVDFYLTKPLGRGSILLRKYGAIWFAYGGVVFACGLIVYLITSLVHGMTDLRIAYLFGVTLINLSIWFSITVAAGVLTRSTPIAIMAAFVVWVAQTILAGHEAIGEFVRSAAWKYVIDGSYYVLPKPSALFDQASGLCVGRSVTDWVPLYSSVLFAAAMLFFAIMVFKKKEF